MYLRHSMIYKHGTMHRYWCVVRSVRVGSRVRQEAGAMLGELDARGRVQARALARAVCGEQRDQVALFEDPTETAAVIPVQPNRVRLERGR